MRSDAATVDAYLEELPDQWRGLVTTLRALVRKHLPDGYEEVMRWGMITYEVPLESSGKTYNGKPLMYVAIGAQKRHVGLYLCGLYCHAPLLDSFEQAYRDAGIKLDMGKACVRLKSQDGIHEDAIAGAVRALSMDDYIEINRR